MAYIFFGEPLTWTKLVGGVLIWGSASLVKKIKFLIDPIEQRKSQINRRK
jgi:drug/metabolite transporter (DMT)-like permease